MFDSELRFFNEAINDWIHNEILTFLARKCHDASLLIRRCGEAVVNPWGRYARGLLICESRWRETRISDRIRQIREIRLSPNNGTFRTRDRIAETLPPLRVYRWGFNWNEQKSAVPLFAGLSTVFFSPKSAIALCPGYSR